jgi:hypothetical protein
MFEAKAHFIRHASVASQGDAQGLLDYFIGRLRHE